ncbi:RNA-binding cell elongation regulator Jag/EloR [Paenibacillus macquariensis]|uniref:RNA-binding protein KhpB n=1 Tax=Paenibacillus macquariensis TaxID=948756 RepID=A0ABY1KA94_9BACL|nr:RNA-binding cell elongation regulator Jag/EloR [Paenibacillus macquariensis]MEC0093773.1 RNA-binding cell elongation regulator Jag/EloR [Paenibacillus macquariensis]OAB31716.1 protein jag [Paenibacillus macquariensis subsp. macquariensis]SIR49727.1 spoIIIJ-associated protein [Paenibacillus macquariensis]
MSNVIASGKTVEVAVNRGLAQLGVSQDRVSVNILSQPSKGFLGLIGVREAKVELTLLPEVSPEPVVGTMTSSSESVRPVDGDPYAAAVKFILDVGRSMGLEVTVDVQHTRDATTLHIFGPDLGLMIGRRGQTLDSLQYLANIVANRVSSSYVRIILDAENFRERRKKTLEELADRLAGRVIRSHKEVVLEPMSPQERKVIHARLQDHKVVNTYSKGEEPNRRVVISLK